MFSHTRSILVPYCIIRIFTAIHNEVFPNKLCKFNIYLSDPWYFLSHSCLYNPTHVCKACDTSPFCSTYHTSVAICLWLSDEWCNLLLTRYCIISTHQEHIVIVLSSVCEVPFETRGRVVSGPNNIKMLLPSYLK